MKFWDTLGCISDITGLTCLVAYSHLLIFYLLTESIPRQVDKKSRVPEEEKGVWGSQSWNSQGGGKENIFFFSTFLSHVKCFSL